jgi:hypothetical protein
MDSLDTLLTQWSGCVVAVYRQLTLPRGVGVRLERSTRWRQSIFYAHMLVAVVFGLVGLKRWYRDEPKDFVLYNPFGLLLAVVALPAAASLLWFALYHVNNLRTSQTTKVRPASSGRLQHERLKRPVERDELGAGGGVLFR